MNNLVKIALVSLFGLSACTTQPATTTSPNPSSSPTVEKVSFAQAKAVITQRCVTCHSATAKDSSFGSPAGGVSFDTDAMIIAKAERINKRAVVDKTMPQGNKTGITQEERDLLGRWIAAGAADQ